MKVALTRPWLTADFDAPRRVLSWSLTRPGFVEARRIIWREVRNADLPEDLDAVEWFRNDLAARGDGKAVAFLTSRNVSHFHEARANIDDVTAHSVATVGLSNAERVGTRRPADDSADIHVGTINIAVSIEQGLTDAAFIETLSIATAARTAAMIDHGPSLAVGQATGTGTDCIAIAAYGGVARYAGMHTAIGEAVGRTVYDAVAAGVAEWMKEQGG